MSTGWKYIHVYYFRQALSADISDISRLERKNAVLSRVSLGQLVKLWLKRYGSFTFFYLKCTWTQYLKLIFGRKKTFYILYIYILYIILYMQGKHFIMIAVLMMMTTMCSASHWRNKSFHNRNIARSIVSHRYGSSQLFAIFRECQFVR